ncbi:hypothetical protein THC_0659 [Caldimicrobium thiodismutans]|uniref:YjgP/YjgQ family permease n=1 Tax=Caldimicrobium thiodismutans TaxID=1653476 RepID=A0A0U4W1P9_9BACT|nr:LptF/LptG family permease [Caldimicrobium thiodismutans]BAU23051.1 hypothetical protein THC_0659 [Caldimicrobium thiodismutans]
MPILYRYFLKEYIQTTGLFLGVFLFLFTLIMGTLNLKEIIDLNPSILHILKVYVYTPLQIFAFLLPLSGFLALLFSFQRMKEEGEILALFSLGFTLKDFFKPFLIFSLILFIFTTFGQSYLVPKVKRLQKIDQMNLIKNLSEKEIPSKSPIPLTEGLYLYVASAEKEGNLNHLKRVVLLEKKGDSRRGLYLAKTAILDLKAGNFALEKGYVFYLENLKNTEILLFNKYFFSIPPSTLKKEDLYIKRGEMSLSELKAEMSKMKPSEGRYFRYLSEYYQRFFYGFSIFSLFLQGFLLGIFLKTQGRLLLFLMGLTFYLFYYFLYNFFISLGESGKLLPLYSHLIFNLSFYILLLVEYVVFKRKGGYLL